MHRAKKSHARRLLDARGLHFKHLLQAGNVKMLFRSSVLRSSGTVSDKNLE